MEKILVFGAGGHAKVVADIILRQNEYEISAFVELKPTVREFCGRGVIAESEISGSDPRRAIIAIGDNWLRGKVAEKLLSQGFTFVSAVHPAAVVAADAKIGAGVVVMAGAVINPGTSVGENAIVNTGASVDHDCELSKFSSVAPGCTLGGHVKVGAYSAVCLGAKIIQGIAVGEHTVIGAGSVAVRDVPAFAKAYGVPCKVVSKRKPDEPYL